VDVALSVLVIFNTLIMLDSWKLKKTPSIISPSHSLKQELIRHYNSFHGGGQFNKKSAYLSILLQLPPDLF
jgi:hypothetical protein